ncbi:MAG: hypothetical protein ACI845_004422 [Gammaproteobacteria bacterium]|jgi:hypothetical protein
MKGRCVPSLYDGSSVDSTIFETIFHDVPTKSTFKTVRKQEVNIRSHSELEALRAIELLKLYAPELMRWYISRQHLIASSPKLYGSQAIHEAFPEGRASVDI